MHHWLLGCGDGLLYNEWTCHPRFYANCCVTLTFFTCYVHDMQVACLRGVDLGTGARASYIFCQVDRTRDFYHFLFPSYPFGSVFFMSWQCRFPHLLSLTWNERLYVRVGRLTHSRARWWYGLNHTVLSFERNEFYDLLTIVLKSERWFFDSLSWMGAYAWVWCTVFIHILVSIWYKIYWNVCS